MVFGQILELKVIVVEEEMDGERRGLVSIRMCVCLFVCVCLLNILSVT